MADIPISSLTALGAAPATNDLLVLVDVSDTTQAPTGTTKKMTTANLFTSPHMTGAVVDSGGLTVTAGGLTVTAGATAVQALTATTVVTTGAVTVGGGFVYLNAATVNFPSLKQSGTDLHVRKGDDSAFTNVQCAGLTATTIVASGTINTTASGGLAIGDIAGRRRLVSTSSTAFQLLNDANGFADLAVDGLATGALGGITVNTNKFIVDAPTGNTAIAGTLVVSGATATLPVLNGIGGLTSSFPALKRNGANLQARLGDDSDYGTIEAYSLVLRGQKAGVLEQTGVSVSTSATDISSPNQGSVGGIAVVAGTDGTNRFVDIVAYASSVATALASQTGAGAPAARTYTAAGGSLRLAMASGSYTVGCADLRHITTS